MLGESCNVYSQLLTCDRLLTAVVKNVAVGARGLSSFRRPVKSDTVKRISEVIFTLLN